VYRKGREKKPNCVFIVFAFGGGNKSWEGNGARGRAPSAELKKSQEKKKQNFLKYLRPEARKKRKKKKKKGKAGKQGIQSGIGTEFMPA